MRIMRMLEFDSVVEEHGLDILLNYFPHLAPKNFDSGEWIAFEKLDGSLISSFTGPYRNMGYDIKSKTSIKSDHVHLAKAILATPEYVVLDKYLHDQCMRGFTVNMELCSSDPKFRIVVPYQKSFLRVLNKRHLITGEISFDIDLPDQFVVRPYEVTVTNDYVKSIKDMVDFEGIILFNTKTNQFVKVKTDWYLQRHRFKFNMSNAINVIEMVLAESLDDMKALFAEDQAMMEYLTGIEVDVIAFYNKSIAEITRFYETHKDWERKDYAIEAQKGSQLLMAQKMNLYLGKELTFKESVVKHAKTIFPHMFNKEILIIEE